MMPLVFFMSPTDPRIVRTIDAILRPPASAGLVSDGLVYRYNAEEDAGRPARAGKARSTSARSGWWTR